MSAPEIVGTVTSHGQPLGSAYVRLVGPSGDFVSEQYTKDDGRFTFFVADGSWTVEARAAGHEPATETVAVHGTDKSLALELTPS